MPDTTAGPLHLKSIYPKTHENRIIFVRFISQVINTYELRMSCWYEEEEKSLVAVTRN
jgi:hypothetical protein